MNEEPSNRMRVELMKKKVYKVKQVDLVFAQFNIRDFMRKIRHLNSLAL
jgi:hypothetical protein